MNDKTHVIMLATAAAAGPRACVCLCFLIIIGCGIVAARCLIRLLILALATYVLRWERTHPSPDRVQVGAENITRCLRLQARATAGITWDLAMIVVLGSALAIARAILGGA